MELHRRQVLLLDDSPEFAASLERAMKDNYRFRIATSLSQAKARLQQLEDSNRQDQQRIFDTYRKAGAAADPAARNAINREVGSIQMDMARRGQELRNLREQIGTLKGELGLTAAKEAAK